MKVSFYGELRRAEAREYTKKDGSNGTSYNMLVECGVDSLQFPTTKEIYEHFEHGNLFKGAECEFTANYNPRYQFNNFVVTEAVIVK